jgi:hypothetical protein
MATLNIVVVAAGSHAMDQECLDLFDLWERLDFVGCGSHLVEVLAVPSYIEQIASDGIARSILWKIEFLGCQDK